MGDAPFGGGDLVTVTQGFIIFLKELLVLLFSTFFFSSDKVVLKYPPRSGSF